MCPLHTSTEPWKGSPHEPPTASRGSSPSPPARSPPQTLFFPLLLFPPLTSHNLAQIFVYVYVSVCSLCWWLTKSPQESNLCVSPHTGCVGCRSRPGLLAEWCWLVDQAPLCLSPPPHPAPSSLPSFSSLSQPCHHHHQQPPQSPPPPPTFSSFKHLGGGGEKSKSLHLWVVHW